MRNKAISLISGGLDSALATKLILEQGIEVVGLTFTSPFSSRRERSEGLNAIKTARELGVRLILQGKGPDYINVIMNPKHGYGKNMNPCIDCRIFMLRKTKQIMADEGASFVITGEVIGQRPMSQRRPIMELIERESGMEGLILRPLCARHFPPSKPELDGTVDRNLLFGIAGRGRTTQFALTRQYNLSAFGDPGGGCLLTDSAYSARLRDLIFHDRHFTMLDIELLNTGRHFRLNNKTKLILGRNKEENQRLQSLWAPPYVMLHPIGFSGPLGILKGPVSSEEMTVAASILASYAKNNDPTITVEVNDGSVSQHEIHRVEFDIEKYRIGETS